MTRIFDRIQHQLQILAWSQLASVAVPQSCICSGDAKHTACLPCPDFKSQRLPATTTRPCAGNVTRTGCWTQRQCRIRFFFASLRCRSAKCCTALDVGPPISAPKARTCKPIGHAQNQYKKQIAGRTASSCQQTPSRCQVPAGEPQRPRTWPRQPGAQLLAGSVICCF